jgi:hypothetical protein
VEFVRDWISYPDIAFEKGLAEYKLDGSVVIAEATRAASYELERIETSRASLEKRRDNALERIAHYRYELGAMLRLGPVIAPTFLFGGGAAPPSSTTLPSGRFRSENGQTQKGQWPSTAIFVGPGRNCKIAPKCRARKTRSQR